MLERSEELVRHDLARMVRQLEEEARGDAKRRARNLVADALQRVAASHAAETTVSIVELPSDDAEAGSSVARNNIRALETSPASTSSSTTRRRRSCSPRSTASAARWPSSPSPSSSRTAHPSVADRGDVLPLEAEIEDHIRQAGEQAVFEANCGKMHEELVKVARPAPLSHELRPEHPQALARVRPPRRRHGLRARASVKTAKRAALLHDVGKAMTHEVEGSHAAISAQMAKRYGESQRVVHAVEGTTTCSRRRSRRCS